MTVVQRADTTELNDNRGWSLESRLKATIFTSFTYMLCLRTFHFLAGFIEPVDMSSVVDNPHRCNVSSCPKVCLLGTTGTYDGLEEQDYIQREVAYFQLLAQRSKCQT
jgi:hypothetical protein